MKKTLLFFCLVFIKFGYSQKTIKGFVYDSMGEPLPSASVLIKGTLQGTETDFDGNYQIEAKEGDILSFGFLGMKTKEITIGKSNVINVELEEDFDSNLLGEIIVTGYDRRKKPRVTGSTETIEIEKLKNTTLASVQEAIQGNISGVQVTSSSGQPGETPNIRIRGVGSFEGSSPLYVIDGLQTHDADVLANLNPNDIENITVLKDASATSIYGTSGSNGVIVVTTKSGASGKTVITLSTQAGFSDATVAHNYKALNTSEFQEIMIEGILNNTKFAKKESINNKSDALNYLINKGFNPNVNSDWYDLLTKENPFFQQHNLSITGGSEKTTFYLSGGFVKQDAKILNANLERFNTLLKGKHEINEKMDISASIAFTKNTSNYRPTGGRFANPVRSIYRAVPFKSPFDKEGNFVPKVINNTNPLAQSELEIRRRTRYRLGYVSDFSYKLTDNISFETKVSGDFNFTDDFERLPSFTGDAASTGGRGVQEGIYQSRFLNRNLLRFDYNFNQLHSLDVFIGYEIQKTRGKRYRLRAQETPDKYEDVPDTSTPIQTYFNKYWDGKNSAFFNAEYSYDDKYLVSGSVRRDGSNKFSPKNKFGWFWSIGLGWNILKGYETNLKLRTSYGKVGNDNIDRNLFLTVLNTNEDYNGQTAETLRVGNPDIKWEESYPLNIGVDFDVYEKRVSGSLDWYHRTSKDLLIKGIIPGINGPVDPDNQAAYTLIGNNGDMVNRGIELTLNTKNVVSEDDGFQWNSSINFTKNTNEVTKLPGDNAPVALRTRIRKVGEDFYTFYLPLYAGADPQTGAPTWYVDETKTTKTTKLSEAKQSIAGKATPDFYASLQNTLRYKGLKLSFMFYSAVGGKLYDTWGRFTTTDGTRGLSSNISRGVYDRRWQNPGDITDVPKIVYRGNRSATSHSSRYIYDGTYIRLRDLTLSYDFDSELIEKLGLKNTVIFVKGTNIWTYVKDERLERDPEAGIDGRLNQEIPIGKTISLGVNMTF